MDAPGPAWLPCEPGTVLAAAGAARRLLLAGAPGTGKSTLAAGMARVLAGDGQACWCLGADPGTPAFGPPGALGLARWSGKGWAVEALAALCSLDAGRFRLPLVQAAAELAGRAGSGVLLVDAPGVVRGVAGAELVTALAQATGMEAVVWLSRTRAVPAAVAALPLPRVQVEAPAAAARPGRRRRAAARTAAWERYLEAASRHRLPLEGLALAGTPPPLDVPEAWPGRQAAVLRDGVPETLGEVEAVEGGCVVLRAPGPAPRGRVLLVRDARRNPRGELETAEPFARVHAASPPGHGGEEVPASPPLAVRVGPVDAILVNGVWGDPLLHVRLRHLGRSLLFDLGEGRRLPARVAHRVSDVFVSHAHMDHLGGFQWLLRSRVGGFPPCRLWGPPGLAGHVAAFVGAFTWDRVGDRGPAFEVCELHGGVVQCWRIRAGRPGHEALAERPAADGVLLAEPGFRVRAVELDHGIPVLAFAFEPEHTLHVRKDRLAASGLAPGPWLTRLKQALAAGRRDEGIALPGGRERSAGELADEFILVSPGRRLVYATDLADTADNRERLAALARNAHTLFCEAPFTEAERDRAREHGHLTARACGEIAAAANVARLVPFHFSRRHSRDPAPLVDELRSACGRLHLPEGLLVR